MQLIIMMQISLKMRGTAGASLLDSLLDSSGASELPLPKDLSTANGKEQTGSLSKVIK